MSLAAMLREGVMRVEREARGSRLVRDLIRWAPKRTFSTALGAIARIPVPRAARSGVYGAYARRFGIDLVEMALPLEDYATLDDFFTRTLRDGARPVDPDPDVAVSPVDCEVLERGDLEGGRMLQVKGCEFTVGALLADTARAVRYIGGVYATLYLSPRDYHRIHAPVAGRVIGCSHVPGELFPVNARAVRDVEGLYACNERLVTFLDGSLGEVAVVKVAACGVGCVTATYDPSVHTHAQRPTGSREYDPAPEVRKGDEIGVFHLGSTVIVLFQPGRVVLESLQRGQRLLCGSPLARRRTSRATRRRGNGA
ncbi:MAG: phosphatidylserine decarboxylase [Deltaproteobacteria bacterium]|nr:phosphatidylserine decarboxylase [Deltaproteobacteria bacterium]